MIIERLYIAHVLLIPAILLALIGAHLALVVRQKHTQFPGPGRTEDTVAGERVIPLYAAKAGGFFFIVFGVCAALGGFAQINPVWLFGPYQPRAVSSGSQPDWYMMFLDGSTRLFPSWEIRLWRHVVPPLFWPTVVLPGILFTLAGAVPVHRGEDDQGHARCTTCCSGPRDVPVRTSLGAMAITFYIVLFLSGGNDIIAKAFDISLNAMTWGGRIALLVLPPLAYLSPTGSAWACSGTTARCSNTASRPASSRCCRPASSSRCTSRSARPTSTGTGSSPTPARRCPSG